MHRVANFSAGPAVLPREVLQQAQAELLDFHGAGMSVMEMSHRSKEFIAIAEQSEADLRALLAIPENYQVLFMQGGASGQFAFVPMNLMGKTARADYLHSGYWAEKAIKAARAYGEINIAASGEACEFTDFPPSSQWNLNADAAYVHYTPNETIGGLEFHNIPATGEAPLVADMSSTILSRPLPIEKFGLIYAGAQKNIGPAGLTLVIVREDLLGRALPCTPEVFDYAQVAKNASMLNTPPTFAWYLSGLVFKWLRQQGGLEVIEARNRRKAELLYAAIDGSDFYRNPIAPAYRSRMNVPFLLADSALEENFLSAAKAAGLVGLKGHRAVGGMRASLYNALGEAEVVRLVDFMRDFENRHG